MKKGKFNRKNICKNDAYRAEKKYISSERAKKPSIAAVWGRHYAGNSDKESSHVVGKCLWAEVRVYGSFPPGQSGLADHHAPFICGGVPIQKPLSAWAILLA